MQSAQFGLWHAFSLPVMVPHNSPLRAERRQWNIRMPGAGFSLIELLIVVAIILIISAIGIPYLVKSKASANEAAAVGAMRTLNSACTTYSSTWAVGFPVALSNLKPGAPATAAAADLIDSVLAAGTKSGYVFTYVSGAPTGGIITTYTINANPQTPNVSGVRYFFTDATAVIRKQTGGAATVASPAI